MLILLPVVCCMRWVSGFPTRLCACPSEMILSVSPQGYAILVLFWSCDFSFLIQWSTWPCC
ncbi:hypothetical protein PVAP13_9KG597101 [Panicum virgatum]|uniref:Uncharacterized protein n=1 Tax=Panicum virgatum TaxID=38727 RepID=A0A8T0P329_PANVG|nr:hypothetical protein PVAP13_9KG597101 [Panicum virgatum]